MNTRTTLPSLVVLALLAAARGALAQEPDAATTAVRQLSTSSQHELQKSIDELNGIREQIANEKLPLDQDLTKYESLLTQLRRDHDKATRSVDEGNLELNTIRNDIKIRKDELSYIANLLDEYARTFESKVNVCELQYIGNAVDTAKQATENNALSAGEKFDRQLVFANLSLQRLFDVIGGLRFPGIGVDLQGSVVKGQYAILGPVALFAAPGGAAGLVVPQSGSSKPLIRPLEGPLQLGLAALVQDGEGDVPLDPSLGGALKALVQKTNIFHVFEKGGPIMWPLLAASILALATVLERILFLTREKVRRSRRAVDEFFAAVQRRDLEGAIGVAQNSKDYVVRALGYALSHRETSLPSALLYAQAQEIKRFRRGIPILDTVITLAPLLGLLGTVTGMMSSFSLIGGDLSAPGAITGGIAEALIATAFGLGIAITSLLPFNFLNARTEDARHELESASTQLELMVHPQSAPASRLPPPAAAAGANGDVGEAEVFAAFATGGELTMHGGGGPGKARIEIIPLIDIIFFLLATFVMVSLSMTKNQGVNVALPTAGTAASLGDNKEMEKAVTLSVNGKGELFYNKDKITIAQLPMKLQTFKSTSKDPKVIINSDGAADFKHVVAVLDEVRKIGIAKVGINTDKK